MSVHSFLSKGATVEELNAAVEAVRKGANFFSQELEKIIKKKGTNSEAGSIQYVELTIKEKQLFQVIQDGLPRQQGTDQLTVKVIDDYRNRLQAKTESNNIAELISFGFRTGILR